jgi:hypothetical protein
MIWDTLEVVRARALSAMDAQLWGLQRAFLVWIEGYAL